MVCIIYIYICIHTHTHTHARGRVGPREAPGRLQGANLFVHKYLK